MGFIDFDGVRYWDIREPTLCKVKGKVPEESLISDSRKRLDSLALIAGDVEQA